MRAAALAKYDIINTPLEQAYEDITRIASLALDMPIALISFVENARQWFKSEIGLGCRETSLETSICFHAIREDRFFEVADLALDERFKNNLLVTADPHVRFYAGAVLRTLDGIALGTVCVLDRKPRTLNDAQREILLSLARQTMAMLELRRTLRQERVLTESQAHHMAIAGHDLRQPLQSMSMAITVIEHLADSAIVLKQLSVAKRAVTTMATGLDELANAATRNASFAAETKLEPVRIGDLFDIAGSMWNPQASSKGVRLSIARSSVTVLADRRLLVSILNNLVGNAIKYTPAGRVLVGCRRRRQGVEIGIYDTGLGIPRQKLEAIFTPFEKIDQVTDGLGLGLTLVKHAADLLEYELKVSSEIGRGSYFGVLIPTGSLQA